MGLGIVENLGLVGTVNLAKNSAQQDWVRDNFAKGNYFSVNVTGDYPRINFYPPNKENDFLSFEASLGGSSSSIYLYRRNRQGKNIYLVEFPSKSGILATTEDIASISDIPVGVPLPWPQDKPPPGYLICNGQHFDKSKYPKLATAYPSGTVPDLRGEFIRGWDNGRGIDSGRIPLSYQSPTLIRTAVLDYVGNDANGVHAAAIGVPFDSADFTTQAQPNTAKAPNNQPIPGGNTDSGIPGTVSTAALGSSTGVSWWFSTRPRNVTFLYIVRAA
ncbi:phage tail protein [Xenorhabdus bovienii]|uniref:phage tail protein n=1 Tax=Xenorhabdus bovienii TaxID=40576 RepID=UPI001E6568F5|nr:phage tail protein [Xenorhabdus bovienii]